MPIRLQSTSTVRAGLSILSSIFFRTLAINFQSISCEQLMHSSSWSSSSSISRLPYLLRKRARLINRLETVAFNIPILNGLTIYSSAPIWRPDNMSFSLLRAVSRITGICDVSILFLIASHNSSPLISGIIMSEITSSGLYSGMMVSASLPLQQFCTVYSSASVCDR